MPRWPSPKPPPAEPPAVAQQPLILGDSHQREQLRQRQIEAVVIWPRRWLPSLLGLYRSTQRPQNPPPRMARDAPAGPPCVPTQAPAPPADQLQPPPTFQAAAGAPVPSLRWSAAAARGADHQALRGSPSRAGSAAGRAGHHLTHVRRSGGPPAVHPVSSPEPSGHEGVAAAWRCRPALAPRLTLNGRTASISAGELEAQGQAQQGGRLCGEELR